jgi:hypothetical protein
VPAFPRKTSIPGRARNHTLRMYTPPGTVVMSLVEEGQGYTGGQAGSA